MPVDKCAKKQSMPTLPHLKFFRKRAISAIVAMMALLQSISYLPTEAFVYTYHVVFEHVVAWVFTGAVYEIIYCTSD